MDLESSGFYSEVRAAYLDIAKREPRRFKVIDANGSIEETHKKADALLSAFLGV
jgi:thymidylate kinase